MKDLNLFDLSNLKFWLIRISQLIQVWSENWYDDFVQFPSSSGWWTVTSEKQRILFSWYHLYHEKNYFWLLFTQIKFAITETIILFPSICLKSASTHFVMESYTVSRMEDIPLQIAVKLVSILQNYQSPV